jgi:glyoxylate reductase
MSEVAVTAPLPGGALARLARRHTVRVRSAGPALSGHELAGFVGGAEALITLLADRVDAGVLALCPRLKVVANYAVGVNNIDLGAARVHRVWVTNTPDVLTQATADLTWALVLAVTRRIVEGDRWLRAGRFQGWKPDLLLGSGLQGKTLGIVGMGRIGCAVAQRALPFGMRVAVHDPNLAPSQAPAGVEIVPTLEALLPRVHVLSLHCPLTSETRGLMNARRLRLLPRGSILINTSRGEIVDESALACALEGGQLGGAGLDVYEREPEVHAGLVGRDNVVLLPHLGSATVETRAAMADLAVDNVLAVLDGATPPTPVVTPSTDEGVPL